MCKEGKVMVYFIVHQGFFKTLGAEQVSLTRVRLCFVDINILTSKLTSYNSPALSRIHSPTGALLSRWDLKLVDAKEDSISEVVLKRFGHKGNHAFQAVGYGFL